MEPMKAIHIGLSLIVLIILLGVGAYMWWQSDMNGSGIPFVSPGTSEEKGDETETPIADERETLLGTSAEGNGITAYHFGTGEKEVLFVGGIHGGYEWNTALVAFELMDYLEANPSAVPGGVKATVVPVLNPDGLKKVVGTAEKFTSAVVTTTDTTPGRFNGNGVDLNRNFDCDWQATGMWRSTEVDGGTAAFSEPESLAIKNYIEAKEPVAVVVFYSSAGGVFSSNCHNGVLPETRALTNLYADASGYPAYEEFNFYEITGDMTNWLAKRGTPAISVLLTDHTSTEWTKNQKGIMAVLARYGAPQEGEATGEDSEDAILE